jgi:hypothetical protein
MEAAATAAGAVGDATEMQDVGSSTEGAAAGTEPQQHGHEAATAAAGAESSGA